MANITQELFEQERLAGVALADRVMEVLKDKDGHIRVEDYVSVLAIILAERCIEAAGNFDPRKHNYTPGQRIFSDQVNALICGDVATDDYESYPLDTVCGLLLRMLTGHGYEISDFPPMMQVFKDLAAFQEDESSWGKAPLTVPADHFPSVLPLRIAYDTRELVDQRFAELGPDTARRFRASVLALGIALQRVSEAVDKKIVLRLALEMVNGMSKTAPMTEAALRKVAEAAPPES